MRVLLLVCSRRFELVEIRLLVCITRTRVAFPRSALSLLRPPAPLLNLLTERMDLMFVHFLMVSAYSPYLTHVSSSGLLYSCSKPAQT